MKAGAIQATAGAGSLVAVTYTPVLARDLLGADEFFVTLLVASYATASFVSSYLFGRAGDIYERRTILRIGLILSVISFGVLLLAYDQTMLYFVRVLNGFSIGMYPGALAAYAYETHMKMGRFASFGALGWGLGTAFAGYAAIFDLRLAFAAASALFFFAFLSAMTLPKVERVRIAVPLFPIETLRRNFPVYAAFLIRHTSASAVWALWPLFLIQIGGDYLMIGIVQGVNSLAQVVFMLTLADRVDCRVLISLGLTSSIVCFLWFMLVQNIIEILPSQILLGFAWACLYGGSLRYVTERNQERATAVGLLQSVQALAGMLGPICAALIFSVWNNYMPIMVFGIVMSALAFLVFLVLGRNLSRTVLPAALSPTGPEQIERSAG